MTPRAPRPVLSRLCARGRVGEDFFERTGAVEVGREAPRGLVDQLREYGDPAADPERVHPAIAPFFLDPASLELRIESRWHHVFALLWWLVRPLLGYLGQLYLPAKSAVVRVRSVALDARRDGRPGVRGIVRRYADGPARAMQVMAYATHRQGDAGYMSAAFPLPYCTLCGVLRFELVEARDDADTQRETQTKKHAAVRLTSAPSRASRASEGRHRGPEGIWLAPMRGPALALPLEETLSLYAHDDPSAPQALRDGARAGETLWGLHEQRIFGLRFATHCYWFSPLAHAHAS